MENSYVPEIYVGDNGNWFVNGYDTGTKAQGEQGKDGITPHIGADGFWYIGEMNTGVKAQGEAGVKGDKGDKGEMGAVGSQGLTGATGSQGATGPQGLTGPQGPTGATGPQGMTGPKGDTGVAGPMGPQGLQGPKGDTGNQGLQGCQGIAGAQGVKGDAGARGPEGPQGKQGIQGIPGPVNLANNLVTTTAGYGLDARQGKALMDEVDKVNSKIETEEFVLLGDTTGVTWKNISFDKSKFKSITLMCCVTTGAALDSVTIPISLLQTYPTAGEISVQSVYAGEPQNYHVDLANIHGGVAIKSKTQYDRAMLYGSLKL